MDEIKISNIVRSLKGRDCGRLFVVVGFPQENYLSLADGKLRRIESPKLKKLKHVEFVSDNETRVGEKLRAGEKVTNAELRRLFSGWEDPSEKINDTMTGGN